MPRAISIDYIVIGIICWGALNMGVQVRGRGATALPNSGRTVGEIRAKQEECVNFRANQPLCPLPLIQESSYAHGEER